MKPYFVGRLGALAAIASCVAIAAVFSTAHAAAPDSLTLQQAVALALTNQPAIVQAEQAVEAADERIATSRSPYYPDISLTGVYARIGPVIEFAIPHGPTEKLAPENNYDVHLGLRQTLYDFGRTGASVDLARAGRTAAGDHVDEVKTYLAYRTISTFNAILILRQNVAVLDDQIDALGRHLDVSRKKAQAGTATEFDVLTTQVRIAATQNDRIDAANALESQEIVFRQLTGLSPDNPIRLSGDFTRTAMVFDGDALTRTALVQRPEAIIAQDAQTSAALQARLVSLGDRPSFGLSVSTGLKNGYPSDLNQMKANYAASVQLQVPVFNGRRTHHQELEAQANVRSSGARLDDLKRQIVTEVDQAVARATASWQKTENATVMVRQAEEALSMARTKYEAGVVTNLDLLDAQTTLTQARLGYLRALYAYSMSLVDLDRATGKRLW
jgi:outer membrane protein